MTGQHGKTHGNRLNASPENRPGSMLESHWRPRSVLALKRTLSMAISIVIMNAAMRTGALAHDGDLDRSFGSQGRTIVDLRNRSVVTGMVIGPDGKIVLVGWYEGALNGTDFGVARLTSSGLLDTSFSSDGITTIPVGTGVAYDQPSSVFLQTDGKIVVVGTGPDTGTLDDNSGMQLVRLNTDGALDSTFNGDGKAFVEFALGDGNYAGASDGLQLANGKLLIVGSASVQGQGTDFAIAKLNADGTRDTTFHGDGRYTFHFNETVAPKNEGAQSVAVDSSGNILVGGIANIGASYDFAIARLTPGGELDPTFGTDGHVTYGFDEGGSEADVLKKIVVRRMDQSLLPAALLARITIPILA